ncbi:MAG: hypothetical protein UZ07_CHB004000913, partial [Chlorobi bacterium OLB7]
MLAPEDSNPEIRKWVLGSRVSPLQPPPKRGSNAQG